VRRIVIITAALIMVLPAPAWGGLRASSLPVAGPDETVLFQDTFSGYPRRVGWQDGKSYGGWDAVYNGYGRVDIRNTNPLMYQAPRAATKPSDTHASLAVTKSDFSALDLAVDTKTINHLRTPVPNPWETAWVLWHYKDDLHFYYFIAKPNGWELGKEDPAYPGAQRFLATGNSPRFPIGKWYRIRVQQIGNQMTVWVDGKKIVSFVDSERPYLSGKVGLYNEDAAVTFDNVSVSLPLP
jgi:hypothetical protein